MKSLIRPAKILLIFSLLAYITTQNVESQKQTNPTWNHKGNIFALGFHSAFCEANQVMTSFRLIRDGNRMYLRFYCLSGLGILEEQFTRYTDWNATNNKKGESLNYLDRHHLFCTDDSSLNGFHMERNGDNIRFRYTCNRVKIKNSGSYSTDYVRSGRGEIQGLAVHEVKAPDTRYKNQAIRGFRLGVRYVNQWCTIFCPSYQDIRFTIDYFVLRNISADNLDIN